MFFFFEKAVVLQCKNMGGANRNLFLLGEIQKMGGKMDVYESPRPPTFREETHAEMCQDLQFFEWPLEAGYSTFTSRLLNPKTFSCQFLWCTSRLNFCELKPHTKLSRHDSKPTLACHFNEKAFLLWRNTTLCHDNEKNMSLYHESTVSYDVCVGVEYLDETRFFFFPLLRLSLLRQYPLEAMSKNQKAVWSLRVSVPHTRHSNNQQPELEERRHRFVYAWWVLNISSQCAGFFFVARGSSYGFVFTSSAWAPPPLTRSRIAQVWQQSLIVGQMAQKSTLQFSFHGDLRELDCVHFRWRSNHFFFSFLLRLELQSRLVPSTSLSSFFESWLHVTMMAPSLDTCFLFSSQFYRE